MLERCADNLVQKHHCDKAAQIYNQLIMEGGASIDKLQLKRAICLYRLGRYEESIKQLDQLIVEYPSSPLAPKAEKYRVQIEAKRREENRLKEEQKR